MEILKLLILWTVEIARRLPIRVRPADAALCWKRRAEADAALLAGTCLVAGMMADPASGR